MGDNALDCCLSATDSADPPTDPSHDRIALLPRETVADECYRFPATRAQQQLWLSQKLTPDIPLSRSTFTIRFRGRLDVRVLERVLHEIRRRHEILRTCFAHSEGQLSQVIQPIRAQPLEIVSFEHLAEPEQEANLKAFAEQQTHGVFDLGEGPLVRLVLARCSADDLCLILTFHRAIFDRPSFAVLSKEFSCLYNAYAQGQLPILPDLPVQYADYSTHQLTYLQSPAYKRDLAYWTAHLADAEFTLGLPTDRPQPPQPTYRGETEAIVMGKTLQANLLGIAHENETTPFVLFLAAFQVLLHKYTQKEDILVGTPISVRDQAEVQNLVGFFQNTLILRSTLAGEQEFTQFLGDVRQTTLEACGHRHLPFEQVVQALQPDHPTGQHPLFQAMFVYDHESEGLDLQGLETRSMRIPNPTTEFDLTLSLIPTEQGLRGSLDYSTDLFDATTIGRMAGHFEVLLHAIAENPQQQICDLPILTEAERHQLLVEWNDTEKSYTRDKCIHQLFTAQAERTPRAIAAVSGDDQLTYDQLDRQANQLANTLQNLDIGPDTPVGLCMLRSLDMIVGLLGILKAGGCYVPLDPDFPRQRTAGIVAEAGIKVVLGQARFAERYDDETCLFLALDSTESAVHEQLDRAPIVSSQLSHLAYVIYTSGSTGRPKGVMIEHGAILNRLQWMQEHFQLDGADAVLQKTPYSFDVSVWEFFWPLMVGARLVFAHPEAHKNPEDLADTIETHHITTIHFVPSMLEVFLQHADFGRCHSLRHVICSGEVLSPRLQERFFATSDVPLVNLYGPTEAAVDVSYWQCRKNGPLRTVPIGRPIANTQLYILDRQLQPLPVGVPGELYIGGIQLARGYLNQPTETNSRFVKDPFAKDLCRRIYRTGDLCRYLPDGNIEFLGRLDHQVKIRGFRIELGEIESALVARFKIREALVTVAEDSELGSFLVANVVMKEGQTLDQASIRRSLKDHLPDYMIPSAFVALEALPLTPSGKVDRKALPQPDLSRVSSPDAYVGPRDPVEEKLVQIWAEVLGGNRVGVHDNFFDLGGHSLLMVKIHARIRQAYGTNSSIHELFSLPTVAGQAAVIASDQANPLQPAPNSDLIDLVNTLSEAEAEKMLQRLSPQSSGISQADSRSPERQARPRSPKGTSDEPSVGYAQGAQEEVPVGISSFVIPTANRPGMLRRALLSYGRNSLDHSHPVRFVVLDSSSEPASALENRQMLLQLQTEIDLSIQYAGPDDKRQFAERLATKGSLPRDVLDYALFDGYGVGYNHGANCNSILLQTIGELAFSADDDTLCQLTPSPEFQDTLQVRTGCDPLDYWYFASHEEAMAHNKNHRGDLLGAHNRYLGKDVCQFDLNAEGKKTLDKAHRTRVLMTVNGILGDNGLASPFLTLLTGGASHHRLTGVVDKYHQYRMSRDYLRVASRPTIADATHVMSTFFGFDHRDLVPPFMPLNRGADVFFARSLWKLSQGVFVHLPWALVHDPGESRRCWPNEILRSASGSDTLDLFSGCLEMFDDETGRSTPDRVQALGEFFMDLGTLDSQAFAARIRGQVIESKERLLAHIGRLLTQYQDAPDCWQDDLKKYCEILSTSMKRSDYWVPLDLYHMGNIDDVRAFSQTLLFKYGQLLHWWPAIVHTAAELKAEGRTLANQLRETIDAQSSR